MPEFNFSYAEDQPLFRILLEKVSEADIVDQTNDAATVIIEAQTAVDISRMVTQALKFWLDEGVLTKEELHNMLDSSSVKLYCQTDEEGKIIELFPDSPA